jgi:hypothetical protein
MVTKTNQSTPKNEIEYPKAQIINNSPHYNTGETEVIDIVGLVMEHVTVNIKSTGFNIGNAIKYICRHQHKGNPIIELEKAKWYLEREIRDIERCNQSERS